MTNPSPLSRANLPVSPNAAAVSRERAESAVSAQPPADTAQPLQQVGGFALKALAHIRAPKELVRS